MDRIQKFISDIDKIKKHYRAEHPSYDGQAVCNQIVDFFIRQNKGLEELASSFGEYWFNTYILSSPDSANEPSEENVLKLSAMQALFDLEVAEEDVKFLSREDWKSLCQLTNYEADSLPLDLLNSMMSVFVDKQAL